MSNVKVVPDEKPKCVMPGCESVAVWTRKPGWMIAPGSPPGDVCETHHCWTRIEGIK